MKTKKVVFRENFTVDETYYKYKSFVYICRYT